MQPLCVSKAAPQIQRPFFSARATRCQYTIFRMTSRQVVPIACKVHARRNIFRILRLLRGVVVNNYNIIQSRLFVKPSAYRYLFGQFSGAILYVGAFLADSSRFRDHTRGADFARKRTIILPCSCRILSTFLACAFANLAACALSRNVLNVTAFGVST